MTAAILLPPPGTLAGEVPRGLIVGAGFLLIFAAAELWHRRWSPPVECTRKFVHFAGGLVVAAFPWIFQSPWTVLALAAAFAGVLQIGRRTGVLHSVHGVERRSAGDLYYPLAVFLLFLLARDTPVVYLVSVLTLVVSDALAAILGSEYGRRIYLAEQDRKSLEGSVVFLLVTFLIVQLPLLLMTGTDRAACVLIAVQIALIVASFEAISLRGSDNLVVPLATYYLLLKILPKSPEFTGLLLLAQLGIIAGVAILVCCTRLFTFSGAIAAHLALYGSLSLGGAGWSAAMALALAGFVALDLRARGRAGRTSAAVALQPETSSGSCTAGGRAIPRCRPPDDTPTAHELASGGRAGPPAQGYQVLGVFYAAIVAVVLLVAHNTLSTMVIVPAFAPDRHSPLFAPFVGALAGQLAVLIFQRTDLARPADSRRSPVAAAAASGAPAWLLVAPLGLLAGGQLTLPALCVSAVIGFGSALVCAALKCSGRWPKEGVPVLQWQAACVAAVTCAALPVHLKLSGVL